MVDSQHYKYRPFSIYCPLGSGSKSKIIKDLKYNLLFLVLRKILLNKYLNNVALSNKHELATFNNTLNCINPEQYCLFRRWLTNGGKVEALSFDSKNNLICFDKKIIERFEKEARDYSWKQWLGHLLKRVASLCVCDKRHNELPPNLIDNMTSLYWLWHSPVDSTDIIYDYEIVDFDTWLLSNGDETMWYVAWITMNDNCLCKHCL